MPSFETLAMPRSSLLIVLRALRALPRAVEILACCACVLGGEAEDAHLQRRKNELDCGVLFEGGAAEWGSGGEGPARAAVAAFLGLDRESRVRLVDAVPG